MRFFTVFAAMVFVDVAYALWARRASQGRALQASLYATLLLVLGAHVTLSYVADVRYLIAAAGGAFVGTYFAVRLDHTKE